MARNNNLYCPACGHKLWYNQSKKSYYCPNSSCRRSPNYSESCGSMAEEVAEAADEEVENFV